MLNKNQFERLAPHLEAIKLTVSSRSTVSTSPFYIMDIVSMEFGRPPTNGYCGSCVMELYDYIGGLIARYEANPSQSQ